MTQDELLLYSIGYRERMRMKQEDDLALAYHVAAFNNSKKPKKLQYYIKKLRNSYWQKAGSRIKPDGEKAKQIEETIAKLKREAGE